MTIARNFHQELAKQLQFIANSCAAFDAACQSEAIRIATSLRVIFHDTSKCKSILNHLFAGQIRLLSTVAPPPEEKGEVVFFGGSPSICVSPRGAFYRVPLSDTPYRTFLPRKEWWNQVLYVRKNSKQGASIRILRKDVILQATNKDGGAHVDAKLTSEYEELKNGPWKQRVYSAEGIREQPIPNAELPMLRQIGYEVLNSPDLLKLAGMAE